MKDPATILMLMRRAIGLAIFFSGSAVIAVYLLRLALER